MGRATGSAAGRTAPASAALRWKRQRVQDARQAEGCLEVDAQLGDPRPAKTLAQR